MKRRDFIKSAGLGVAAAGVAAPAIAQSMPELKWRLTSSFPKSLDTLYGGAQVFVKAVAEASDNKFQIQPFAAGEIIPALQALDAATSATVEIAQSASYYFTGKDPAFAWGTAVPFGLNSRMQNAWVNHGGGEQLLNDFYKKFNVYGLVAGQTNCQMGGWFRKEIKEPADLSGLKFRIASSVAGQLLAKLGVVPQQIAGGDIYPALEKGTIDAAEWVGPYDDEKLGFQKIAQYYYYPGWWEGGAMLHMFFNLDKWNSLTPAYQAIVRAACAQANTWVQSKYDAVNPAALKRLVASGAQLRPFSPSILDACYKAAVDTYAEVSASNADFKTLHDSVMAFRGDQYLWWQIAEYSYDTYMIKARARG
jgi:TRAP-type mannitol/chloroaromatic compound transport system substrate-binding protein